jgi:hypothetical protein
VGGEGGDAGGERQSGAPTNDWPVVALHLRVIDHQARRPAEPQLARDDRSAPLKDANLFEGCNYRVQSWTNKRFVRIDVVPWLGA